MSHTNEERSSLKMRKAKNCTYQVLISRFRLLFELSSCSSSNSFGSENFATRAQPRSYAHHRSFAQVTARFPSRACGAPWSKPTSFPASNSFVLSGHFINDFMTTRSSKLSTISSSSCKNSVFPFRYLSFLWRVLLIASHAELTWSFNYKVRSATSPELTDDSRNLIKYSQNPLWNFP